MLTLSTAPIYLVIQFMISYDDSKNKDMGLSYMIKEKVFKLIVHVQGWTKNMAGFV